MGIAPLPSLGKTEPLRFLVTHRVSRLGRNTPPPLRNCHRLLPDGIGCRLLPDGIGCRHCNQLLRGTLSQRIRFLAAGVIQSPRDEVARCSHGAKELKVGATSSQGQWRPRGGGVSKSSRRRRRRSQGLRSPRVEAAPFPLRPVNHLHVFFRLIPIRHGRGERV
jgi:hypothetical protein